MRRSAKSKEQDHQHYDGGKLNRREDHLHRAARLYPEIVDQGQHQDGGNRHAPNTILAQRNKVSGVPSQNHGDGCDNSGVNAPKHPPSPQEAQSRRKDPLEENVDAPGVGKGRGQFGANQRAA